MKNRTALCLPDPAGTYRSAEPAPWELGNSICVRTGSLVTQDCGLTPIAGNTWGMKSRADAAACPWGVDTTRNMTEETRSARSTSARRSKRHIGLPSLSGVFDNTGGGCYRTPRY